jgi:hypothetical protein
MVEELDIGVPPLRSCHCTRRPLWATCPSEADLGLPGTPVTWSPACGRQFATERCDGLTVKLCRIPIRPLHRRPVRACWGVRTGLQPEPGLQPEEAERKQRPERCRTGGFKLETLPLHTSNRASELHGCAARTPLK